MNLKDLLMYSEKELSPEEYKIYKKVMVACKDAAKVDYCTIGAKLMDCYKEVRILTFKKRVVPLKITCRYLIKLTVRKKYEKR